MDVSPTTPGVRRLGRFTGRSLFGLLAVIGAGAAFGLLLVLVRYRWAPLFHVDRGVADRLNEIVSQHKPLVTALLAVSNLGGRPVMVWLVLIVAVAMFIRGQRRLPIYLLVTGIGALMLDPSLKIIVGRLRPVVEAPVANAPGNSFPSGHALGSMVAYGSLLLVFLPVLAGWRRVVAIAVAALIVVLVGFTRIALGVHYLSDVLAGWLLGAAWLGVTGYAFRLWRREAGEPAPPITEGIEPDAARELTPAPDEEHVLPRRPRAAVAEIVTGWVLTFGLLFVFGVLVTRYTPAFDTAIPQWFAEHRTPALDGWSWWLSKAGDTNSITAVSLLFCPLAVAVLRQLRPALFVALAMIGEVTLFLAVSRAVGRERPPVPQLDGTLPTSAFPSGHLAATICLYTAITLIVLPRTTRWWRWLPVVALVVLPVLVAVSRLYRGMHHPADEVGAVVLAALWMALLWWVVRPDLDGTRWPSGTREGEAAHADRGRRGDADRRRTVEVPTGRRLTRTGGT